MITIPVTILSVPLVIAMWAIDSVLFLVVARLILGRIGPMRVTASYRSLEQLIDPVAARIGRWLSHRTGRSVRQGAQWMAFILGLCTARWVVVLLLLLAVG